MKTSTADECAAKRPLSVTLIGWIFISVGAVALVYHLSPQHIGEVSRTQRLSYELAWICLVRLLAIIAGAFMLRGANWARWLAVIWLAYHVALSALHSVSETAMHGLLLAIISYFLFRARSSIFFRGSNRSPQAAASNIGRAG